MTFEEVTEAAVAEIAAFSGRASLLCADLDGGEALCGADPGAGCPAGTAIALPLLVCALEQVRKGRRAPEERLPTGEPLDGALARMAAGDPAALAAVTGLLGVPLADEYFQGTLGLRDTACGGAPRTSTQSLCYLLGKLHRGEILTQALRERALELLRPAPPAEALPRPAAAVEGRGEALFHTAGIYPVSGRTLYLGVCVWDAPAGAAAGLARRLARLTWKALI